MSGFSLSLLLADSAFLSVLFAVLVFGSLRYNPRLWLQDYPAEIRAKAAPLTQREQRERAVVSVVVIGVYLLAPYLSAARLEAMNGTHLPFLSAYAHVAALLNIVNLFDALVIDFLVLALMKPKFATIPGAEGMEYLYEDWHLHLMNFGKGVVFASLVALPIAFFATLQAQAQVVRAPTA